jgi:hypothetical protein
MKYVPTLVTATLTAADVVARPRLSVALAVSERKYMGSDSINQYYAAPCLLGLPFGNGTALRSVKRSIFD